MCENCKNISNCKDNLLAAIIANHQKELILQKQVQSKHGIKEFEILEV